MQIKIIYTLSLLCLISQINSSLKFNIPSNRETCFMEELYGETPLLIRYDLTGFTEAIKQEDQNEVLRNIKITIKNQQDKVVNELNLPHRKDKYVYHSIEEGRYKICVKFYRTWKYKELPKTVFLKLKFSTLFSNYGVEVEGLKKEDVKNFEDKLNSLKRLTHPSIASAKLEVKTEDETAQSIISTSNLYYKLTLIQIILIFVVTIYHVINFNKYLSGKRII